MVQQTRRRLPGLRHVVARRRVAVALRVATVAHVARRRQSQSRNVALEQPSP